MILQTLDALELDKSCIPKLEKVTLLPTQKLQLDKKNMTFNLLVPVCEATIVIKKVKKKQRSISGSMTTKNKQNKVRALCNRNNLSAIVDTFSASK